MKMLLHVAAYFAMVQASAHSLGSQIPLGEAYDPMADVCAGGASCYATNSMLIPRCGNFQASCSNDSQCAFNTCNAGFCNGRKLSTTSSDSSTLESTSTGSSCVAIASCRCEDSTSSTTPILLTSSVPVTISESPSSLHPVTNSTTLNLSAMTETFSASTTSTSFITQLSTTTSFPTASYVTSFVIVSGHTSSITSSLADSPTTPTSSPALASGGSNSRSLARKQPELLAVLVAWIIV